MIRPIRKSGPVPVPRCTRRSLRYAGAVAAAALVALTLSAAGGCQTRSVTGDGRPMPPEPRQAPRTPDDATVNRMAFIVSSKPDDSTGSGYPDRIRATVVLFAQPHPTSVSRDGTFTFELYRRGDWPEGDPLAVWTRQGESVARSRTREMYGPAHQFQLSLLETELGERHPLSTADLIARFEPADGGPAVESDSIRRIQIGRRDG